MSLPQIDYTGQTATISAMELRAAPGDALDRAARGMTIYITKHGRHIATLGPSDSTVVHPDGRWTGARPLTIGRPELIGGDNG